MHEMSLAESILRILEDQAEAQGFQRVKTVRLEIGQLSHAAPDAIRFCFEAVVRGTIAEGAALEIDCTPGKAWCETCAKSVPVSGLAEPCPECGGHRLRVTEGDEMRVRELEVD
jgi:hydrogenase nickel incorporation protein HypA/HybF